MLRGDPASEPAHEHARERSPTSSTGRPADTEQLSEAGVSTGATTGSGALNQDAIAGKLTLDATKLTERLAANFDDVKSLFTKVDRQRTRPRACRSGSTASSSRG